MIQDAFGTPGAQPNIGVEVRALDVIGYNRVSFASPVPEPGTWLLLASGLCACRYQRRSRKQA